MTESDAVAPLQPSRVYSVGSRAQKLVVVVSDVLFGTAAGYALLLWLGNSPTLITALLLPGLIFGLYVAGQYDEYHPRELSTAAGIYTVIAGALGTLIILLNALDLIDLHLCQILLISTLTPAAVLAWRLGFRIIAIHATPRTPVIIIGTGDVVQAGRSLVEKAPNLRLVDVIDSPNHELWTTGTERHLLRDKLNTLLVLVGLPHHPTGLQAETLVNLRRKGASVLSVTQMIEETEERLPLSLHREYSLESWSTVPITAHMISIRLKRAMDLVGALLLTIVLALPAAIAALATRLSDGSPALYSQRRVGQGGHLFDIYKIRSMIVDAEQASGPVWSQTNDPRITRLGRFLRKSRLDEVPQLWNVLTGEMSLVGPRPERPEFTDNLAKQIPLYESRHIVKPGLTGWAQVRYPYGASVDDAQSKLEYDLFYIRHWSLLLDLRILLKTVGIVLRGHGGR